MPTCCVYVDTSENRVVLRQCAEDAPCPTPGRAEVELYSFTVSSCDECPPYPTQGTGEQKTGSKRGEGMSPKEELANLRRRFEELFEGDEEEGGKRRQEG